MEPDSPTAGDFQRSTRMPLDAVVRLHFEGTVAYQNGFAANVSATGMFVKHPAPPPVGTPLVFEFNLGAQRKPVQGSGEVVWVRDRYLGPGQPAGVGIRFAQIDARSRDHIAEALFEFLERSLAEDSYLDPQRLAGQIGAEPESLATLPPVLPEEPPPPPLDLASVPKLPPQGESERPAPIFPESAATPAPPPASADRQPFAVFSPIDSADARTAAIVREALRDEPTAAPPLTVAGAASARPSGTPGAIWAVLAIVAVASAGWYAWQRWGGDEPPPTAAPSPSDTAPPPAEPERPAPEPLPGETGPGTTLAETVGVDPSVRSPAADPPSAAGRTAPVEPTADPEVAAPVQNAAARDAASAGIPATTDEAPAGSAPAAARRVSGLEWRAEPGTSELWIRGDGTFRPGSFSYSEIGGENPRVLVKLKGMEAPFRGAPTGAAAPFVRGVRSGFHVTGKGNEIHLVVDLNRPAAKVTALEPSAGGLVLRLTPPAS